MRQVSLLLLAAGFAAALATGCSSSTSSHPGATDSGPTSGDSGPGTDGGPDTGTDTGTGDAATGDTGTGPCVFSTYVMGLVNNDTTSTALPTTNLGAGCTDDQDASDYQVYF